MLNALRTGFSVRGEKGVLGITRWIGSLFIQYEQRGACYFIRAICA